MNVQEIVREYLILKDCDGLISLETDCQCLHSEATHGGDIILDKGFMQCSKNNSHNDPTYFYLDECVPAKYDDMLPLEVLHQVGDILISLEDYNNRYK